MAEDHGILGIPKGCRALYYDHDSPCTGHLVPELSYMAVIYNLTLWLASNLL